MKGSAKAEKAEQAANSEAEQGYGKMRYIDPRVKNADPETKFEQVYDEDSYSFANIYDAKKYIGELIYQNCRTETYADYADVFDLVLVKSLKKKEIDTVWGEIKRKVMAL